MEPLKAKTLGPFELGDRIGAGGMSEVFHGVHTASGEQVALKVTHFPPGDDRKRRAFGAEIAAMARVYHPGIVAIHDWGTLPDGHGNWCAMDLSTVGCLRLEHIQSWAQLLELLQQLLSALGHAHARDIVHRDLKPQNVLVFELEGRVEYRLADFGLAYSRVPSDETKTMGGSAGTPAYMAPEQLHGLWREYGPWTDLYAIGCIAYELAVGRPPFRGQLPLEVAMAHINGTIDPLVPRFAVPSGFEEWLLGLMGRNWLERPRTAAAAVAALKRLGEPDVMPGDSGTDLACAPTLEFDATLLSETLVDLGFTPARTLAEGAPEAVRFEPVLVPHDWRTPSRSQARFRDAGSRLFSLRQTDFMGHEEQRDQMWASLGRAVTEGVSQVVLIDSEQRRERHLVLDWLFHRTREATGILTIRLDFTLRGVDPFRDALEGLLATWRLSGERLRAHLNRALPRLLERVDPALSTALIHALELDADTVRGQLSARAAFWDLLEAMAKTSPVVLGLDGLARDQAAWFMLERLQLQPLPVLAVAVLGDEWLPTESEIRVRQHQDTVTLLLGSMSRATAAQLVDSYIQLAPDLRERWIALAVEDIAFAMDSLRYGIAGRVLMPSPAGYRMVPGVRVSPTPRVLLSVRVRALAEESADAMRLITLAAAIGSSVSFEEWAAVADSAGVALRAEELEILLRHGFLSESHERYFLESPETRRGLLRHLIPQDREVLLATATDDLPGVVRSAELLLSAGDVEGAANMAKRVFFAPREELAVTGWMPVARRIAGELEDPLQLELDIQIVDQICGIDAPSHVTVPINDLLSDPRYQQFPDEIRQLKHLQAIEQCYAGEFAPAERTCLDLLDEIADTALLFRAEVLNALGWILVTTDRLDEASDTFERSIALFESLGRWGGAALAAQNSCMVPTLREDPQATIASFERASRLALRANDPLRLAEIWLERSFGFILVHEHELALEDARDAWRLGIWAQPSMRAAIGGTYALALGHLGRFADASQILNEAHALQRPDHQDLVRRQLRAVQCVLDALAGDTAAWQRQLDIGPPYDNIGVFGRLAAEAWERQGDAERANQAFALLVATPEAS